MKRIYDVETVDDILQTDKVILRCGNFSGAFAPLVRCRDCEYWNDGHPSLDCNWDFEYHEDEINPDNYCSGAKRKQERL